MIDAVARRQLGRDDAAGDALARQVAELSGLYTRDRASIGGDDRTRLVAARLRFFLPRDLPKVMAPLAGLALAGALPTASTWSVLDLGAGLGATCLGASRFARVTGSASALDVVAVDPFARGLTILEALASRAEEAGLVPTRVTSRVGTMDELASTGAFDVVLLGLSLNEWARGRTPSDAAQLLARLGQRLTPGGSLIVIEPALKSEARFLQQTRDALAHTDANLTLFAPCVSSAPCAMLARERDWCHAEIPGDLPEALAAIARGAGLRRSRRTFAYLTLRRGPVAEVPTSTFRVVSEVLESKGKHELHLCGDGVIVRATRLVRHASEANEAFVTAVRGDSMRLSAAVADDSRTVRIGPDDDVTVQGMGRATDPPN